MNLRRGHLGAVIYDALSSDPKLAGLLGDHIAPTRPARASYPCISWVRIAGGPQVTHSGPLMAEEARVRFCCWAKTRDEAEAVSEALRDALAAIDGQAEPESIHHGTQPDIPGGGLSYVIVETTLWYEPSA